MEEKCEEIANAHGGLGSKELAVFKQHLMVSARIYARKRESEDLWKICEGKEILRSILPHLGLTDEAAVERAIATLWVQKPELVSSELQSLRRYIQSL